jgi:hypothetical protein
MNAAAVAPTGACSAPPQASERWLAAARRIVASRRRDIDEKAKGLPYHSRNPYSAEEAHRDFDELLCEIVRQNGYEEIASLFRGMNKRY